MLSEKKGSAGWIILDRPEMRNALSAELVAKTRHALAQAIADPTVRSIVLAGAGKAFSAGADLNEMKASRNAPFAENVDNALGTSALFYEIAAAPKPVIARVHGPALAGALGIVSACDVTVAAAGVSFAFTEARLGIAPAMISPFVIRRIGPARAQRLFLTGESFSAEQAERFGLIDHVVAPDRLDSTVEEICRDFERCAPGALAAVKEIVAHVLSGSPEENRRYTAEMLAKMRSGEEGQEGMASFLEKRPPRWAK
ncbi:MAG: enoyl-CoA hydratase-related protein [Candidatus Binatia bacterium]